MTLLSLLPFESSCSNFLFILGSSSELPLTNYLPTFQTLFHSKSDPKNSVLLLSESKRFDWRLKGDCLTINEVAVQPKNWLDLQLKLHFSPNRFILDLHP